MKVYENDKYIDDLKYVASLDLPWEKLDKVDEIKKLLEQE